MIKHFVSPPEHTKWRMDPGKLVRALRARWPAMPGGPAELDIDEGPFEDAENRLLEWRISPDLGNGSEAGRNTKGGPEGGTEGLLEGALSREADTVILAGDLGACARFAIWVREELVPEEQPLLFYDDAFVNSAELEKGMDEEELLAAFSRQGAISR